MTGGTPLHSQARVIRDSAGWALLGVGTVLLLLSALPVDPRSVPGWEQDAFRLVNDAPVLPYLVIWPFMQLGNLVAVPIVALVAAIARLWRLAVGLLVGGVAAWVLAKVVKGFVERARPDALLDDVQIRGAAAHGRGYVSGHAAVVTLLVALAWPYLGRRSRAAVVIAACLVFYGRMYVGAHLPLDIVGGAALGLAIAGAVRLLVGRVPRQATLAPPSA